MWKYELVVTHMAKSCPILVSNKDASFLYYWSYNIDEFETYLDGIDGGSLCLFNTMVAILVYVDEAMLSKLGVGLQRLLNKPYELCNSSCLDVKLSKIKP